ncbi:MerR family transcriptional regulator [Staphylococcus sp. 18_1_E_LY]|uniref:MerR family transcriptional regulator n=1 Tax=Staphylococcus lloydii TaxID=2781774 RepID=A0A7T1B032_9STAP|nr:MerR family transcriptional regulator [Staphylococcus lloydii]MBF7019863.1 MerR family transcriptional regulator [Staphylococcus lloydii]MBF7027546.1 MerR family transcriptional regulator [Staphylococcus lloydii]QPM75237.1 MerR family transcriptional regulator [Staphylococcus lloydii]
MNTLHLLKTGAFSKVCKVSKDTIFHYEELELLLPFYKNEKGYRFYHRQQVETVYLISVLQDLNMSLKEIKSFINELNPEKSKNKLLEESYNIDLKIDNLQKAKQGLEHQISVLDFAQKIDFSQIKLEQVPDEPLFISKPLKDVNNLEENIADFYLLCREKFGLALSIGIMLNKEEIYQNTNGDYNYKYLYIRMNSDTSVLKSAGLELIAYHIGDYENIIETYKRMIDYIENNQLEIINFSYEDPIYDILSVQQSTDYVTKINIPVRKCL